MKKMNYKEIMSNSILNTHYATKGRLEKFLRYNGYIKSDKVDCYTVFSDQIDLNTDKVVLDLQEYEYEKNYTYFSCYEVNSEDLINKILHNKELINTKEKDHLSYKLEKPSMKDFHTEVDLKFSLLLKDRNNGNTIKYPIIITIFRDINLLIIKFCSVSEDFYESEFYIKTNNDVKHWIINKLDAQLEEFDSMKSFEKLYYSIRNEPDKHENESIHSILRDDEMNGRSYFRASSIEMLPFIDDLLKLSKTFENENDKRKVEDYINRYESESITKSIAIKWKNKFKSSSGKVNSRLGSITVNLSKVFSLDIEDKLKYEFILHHVHQKEGINRERINYVVKYISNYSTKSKK
ncbi:MAG: hypothetical protein Q8936_17180 [Bacillota bacterium]|nr:hypothetical protein [Bacillota bacterium]